MPGVLAVITPRTPAAEPSTTVNWLAVCRTGGHLPRASSSPRSSLHAGDRARGRRRRPAVGYRGGAARRRCCAPITAGCTRRTRSTRTSPPTPLTGDAEARRRAPVAGRPDVPDARRAQQPDGAARHHRLCGTATGSRSTTPIRAPSAGRVRSCPAFRAADGQVRVISPSTWAAGSGRRAPPGRTWCWRRWRPGRSAARSSALSRQQMFSVVGLPHPDHPAGPARRRPQRQADRDRPRRLRADLHALTSSPSRPPWHPAHVRGAEPRTTPPAGRLDVPTPAGCAPLARPRVVRAGVGHGRTRRSACGVDPIDLRIRNEPAVEPEGGSRSHPQPGRLPARGRRLFRLGRAGTRGRVSGGTGAG